MQNVLSCEITNRVRCINGTVYEFVRQYEPAVIDREGAEAFPPYTVVRARRWDGRNWTLVHCWEG